MRTFIAKNQKTQLKITFKYDLKGILRILEFEGDWMSEQISKVITRIPTTSDQVLIDIANQDYKSAWIFAELSDVSFANFYKQFPRKVGPKETTEKAWNKLGNVDKMEAILFIPELIKLKSDGTAFPYPATYLKQKYWK